MTLDWVILSNSSEVQRNLAYIQGGGWDTAWRPAYPAAFLGALTLRFVFDRLSGSTEHKVTLHFLDQDGAEFAPAVEISLGQMDPPGGWPEDWDVPGVIAIGLQPLSIPRAGRYSVEVLLDDLHQKSLPFQFLEGPLPAAFVPGAPE